MTGPADSSDLWLDGPWRHREVTANGVRLHVVEAGAGPLVLLLHGFPECWWAWRGQIPVLAAAGYRVIAVDLRGFGGSDKPPRGYDMFTASADVAGLIRASGEADATVVGHGLGGLIGWTTAVLHGGAVRRLAVLSAPHPRRLRREFARSGPQRRALAHVLRFQLPRLPERSITAADGAGISRIMRDWAGPEWSATEDFNCATDLYRRAIGIPQAAYGAMEYYRWAVRSSVRPDGLRYAEAMTAPVTVPTLQLHGLNDPVMFAHTAAGSGMFVKGLYEWRAYAGLGHFLPEEDPAQVNSALVRWLEQTA